MVSEVDTQGFLSSDSAEEILQDGKLELSGELWNSTGTACAWSKQ